MDLLRAILLDAETHGSGGLNRWSDKQVGRHRTLLIEGRYLCEDLFTGKISLTRIAEDFLDVARSSDVWWEVRETMAAHGITSFDLAVTLAKSCARAHLGLPSST